MDNLTCADVPARLLQDAFLVDFVPFRALQADPRVSYCLYVPRTLYSADGRHGKPALPLLVHVHGTGRRAEGCCISLRAFADQHRCAVLAPLFPMGVGGRFALDNYKALRYGEIRFDLLLLAIVDEVRQIWGPGIATDKFFLMGFSGGGQFAHRFLFFHPSRLHAVVIGAPGRPTSFSDESQKWPQGVADVEVVFEGAKIDLDQVRQVKSIQLIVGAEDTEVAGKGLIEWLGSRTEAGSKVSSHVGGNGSGTLRAAKLGRVATLAKVYKELNSMGIEATMTVVPGAEHEMLKILPSVCQFLGPLLTKWWEGRVES